MVITTHWWLITNLFNYKIYRREFHDFDPFSHISNWDSSANYTKNTQEWHKTKLKQTKPITPDFLTCLWTQEALAFPSVHRDGSSLVAFPACDKQNKAWVQSGTWVKHLKMSKFRSNVMGHVISQCWTDTKRSNLTSNSPGRAPSKTSVAIVPEPTTASEGQ